MTSTRNAMYGPSFLRFPRNLKYVVNSLPNPDHSNRLDGSRIYWRAKSQRHTKIFRSRILIENSISRWQLLRCDARPWRGDSVGTRSEIIFLE
jgi:hypothetical protein